MPLPQPEQAPNRVGAPSDLYRQGNITFALWNGETPFLDALAALKEALDGERFETISVYLSLANTNVAVPDGEDLHSEWSDILGTVRYLSIADDVEEVRCEYLSQFHHLLRVTFGMSSSLKRTGLDGFSGCLFLEEVYIPDSVEEISDFTLLSACRFRRVVVGKSPSLKRIGRSAFDSTCLQLMVIPDSVEEIGESCFFECHEIDRVIFGESSSLKYIGPRAFSFSYLTEIKIPDSVEEIGEFCFYHTELQRVTFGRSPSLKKIGARAFDESCLMEIRIPDSVEELPDKCFYNCKYLSRVTFGEVPSVKHIGRLCFYRCKIKDISLPATVVSVGGGVFCECLMNESVTFEPGCPFLVSGGLLFDHTQRVCYGCTHTPDEVVIPDSVEELCDACFCECQSITRVKWGPSPSLRKIGSEAFALSHLGGIEIPDSVEELGEMCFYKCKSLSRVTFGESSSLKRIGVSCFSETGLAHVSLPPGIVSFGGLPVSAHGLVVRDGLVMDSCLKEQRLCYTVIGARKEVVILDSVVEIADRCFEKCASTTVVTLRSSSLLRRIGIRAFAMMPLKELVIPDTVEEICDECFYSCGVGRLKFGESPSLKRIGAGAFTKSILEEIDIPDSVEELGDKCFHTCFVLARVTFGKGSSLRSVGIEIFGNCGQLRKVETPDSLKEIMADALRDLPTMNAPGDANIPE